MDVSIIFVNWNSVDYLRESITSIYEHTCDTQFELIVVDNASPAGDVDILGSEFPGIILIKSSTNLGFARANNLGFKRSAGKYLVFLNPDTRLISPAIDVMYSRLRSLPSAGVVGCKLLNRDLSVQTSCIQKFPTILNQVLDTDYLRRRWPNSRLWGIAPLFSSSPEPSEVEVISGACMMIRRDVFETIGLFSEEYFMYAEDVDLCLKARQAGLANYFVADASVIHYGGGSSRQKAENQWSAIAQRQAILQLCRKTRGPLYAWIYRATTAAAAAGRLLAIALCSSWRTITTRKHNTTLTNKKWMAVLKWAIGLEKTPPRPRSNAPLDTH